MSQAIQKNNFKPGSLRGPRTARTVLLRMAADDARAERIALLKDERPDLTWRRIAETVGVSERAAFEWKKTGGIDYENAKKLAVVFDVDVDYIWSGIKNGTPDPFAKSDGDGDGDLAVRIAELGDRLARIEQGLDVNREEREINQGKIHGLLNRQTAILERIEVLVATLPSDETTRRLLEAIRGAA